MIKALFLDVDGVLTDGGIVYDENGVETKKFNVKDGLGIKLAQHAGIEVIIISGRRSKVTEIRAAELGIKKYYTGVKDKVECFRSVLKETGLSESETAFIGDDLNDLKLLKSVGFSAAPPDTFDYIKSNVDYVTERNAGYGAVRDFIEQILKKNGTWEDTLSSFL